MSGAGRRVMTVAATALLVAGCGSDDDRGKTAAAINPKGERVKLKVGGVPKGQRTVRLVVIQTKSRETLALVPVKINGKGPFPFAVDTGASGSLIDAGLARKLHLRDEGSTGLLTGVAGAAHGRKTRLTSWSIGSVRLPAGPIASLKLVGPGEKGPMGLLGSDVLSRFGQVAIDYQHSKLILDPRLRR